jgi:HD domain
MGLTRGRAGSFCGYRGWVTSTMLRRALIDPGDLALRPLPDKARTLLEMLDAPPRLAAHLRLIHDVACQFADWMQHHQPSLKFDRTAVLFGAATHDIGKVVHVSELSGPGSAHEQAGFELLLAHGVDEQLARFARTHASWTAADVEVEDLLVSVADKVWKAARIPDLEQLLMVRIAEVSSQPSWQLFMALDDEVDRIAADATTRLAFQAEYPVNV